MATVTSSAVAQITETQITETQRVEITAFVDQWEKMGHAYFWTPPSSASSRRSYERHQSREISIEINDDLYTGSIDVSCSCKNVYVTRSLRVNGEIKRITTIKKLLK